MRSQQLFILSLLSVMGVSFSSCLSGYQDSTPILQAGEACVSSVTGTHDTILLGDTLLVGDTLTVPLLLHGGYNFLKTFEVTADKSVFDLTLIPDTNYLHLMDSSSAPQEGKLRFVAGCYLFETKLRYVPQTAGDYRIEMTLSSDASEKFTPRTWWFTQCVR